MCRNSLAVLVDEVYYWRFLLNDEIGSHVAQSLMDASYVLTGILGIVLQSVVLNLGLTGRRRLGVVLDTGAYN